MLLAGFLLAATSASAQMDSAAMVKKQKEIEKSEKAISSAQSKVDKKERKMAKAQKRADRKARKADKKQEKLRKAERKHDKLIRDTSSSYIQPANVSAVASSENRAADKLTNELYTTDPAERLYNNVRV